MLNWIVTYIGGNIVLFGLVIATLGLMAKGLYLIYYKLKNRSYWSERRETWNTTAKTKGK